MGTESSLGQSVARTTRCYCSGATSFEQQSNGRRNKKRKPNTKSKHKLKPKTGLKSDKRYKLTVEAIDETTNTAQNVIDYITPYWSTLNQITANDAIYYKKCIEICSIIEANITNQSSITHSRDSHENNWSNIHSMAQLCHKPLHDLLQNLVNSIQLFSKYKTDNNSEATEVIKADLKKFKRAKEKVATNYNGNWLCLIDVCRASIVHNNFRELYFVLLILTKLAQYSGNYHCFRVVKVKNRYTKTTDQGWADITISFKPDISFKDTIDIECSEDERNVLQMLRNINGSGVEQSGHGYLPGHVCEVQLIHRAMWNKRKNGLFGHKMYGMTRSADAEAVKAANKIAGAWFGGMVNEGIQLRGDVVGKVGATIAVKDNSRQLGEDIGNKYKSYV